MGDGTGVGDGDYWRVVLRPKVDSFSQGAAVYEPLALKGDPSVAGRKQEMGIRCPCALMDETPLRLYLVPQLKSVDA